jgi:hypothetical protein
MRKNSSWGCLLFLFLIIVIILPIRFALDTLEKHDMCYEIIPFCESKQEEKEKEFKETKDTIDYKVKNIAQNSAKKWHNITEYKAKKGGYVYYLGTNTMNGVYLYWNGDVDNYDPEALDYQAQDKLFINLYQGKDRLKLIDEFLDSEEADTLNKEFNDMFN